MKRTTFTLAATPPYDFNLTAAYAVHFRSHHGADIFDGHFFRRLLDLKGHLCLVSVRSLGTLDSPRLELEVAGAALDEAIVAEARRQVAWILGTDEDLTRFYRMAVQDPALAPLVRGLMGLHVPHTVSVYEALVLAILGQQVNSHVAHMLRNLLIKTYGPSTEVSGVTYHAFPQSEVLVTAGVEGLRAIKFSTKKSQYLVDIAAGVASGELNLEGLRGQPDKEVIRALTSLRGVGLWTAHWLLILALGRSDGFPDDDLALQRILGVLVNEGTPLRSEQALEYSRRWLPFRSYVTTYLFAALRSGRLPDLISNSEVLPNRKPPQG